MIEMEELVLKCMAREGAGDRIVVKRLDEFGYIDVSIYDGASESTVYLSRDDIAKIAKHVGLDVAEPKILWPDLEIGTKFKLGGGTYEVVMLKGRKGHIDKGYVDTDTDAHGTTVYFDDAEEPVEVVK